MTFDDDSIMACIANELDLDSAAIRLHALGYTAIYKSPHECKFIRSIGQKVQGLHLQLDSQKHFRVVQSENGTKDKHVDCIESWDDWVVFVRLQVYLTQILRAGARPDIEA